nr:palindromic element RPE3 domain-containing protein [Rickettsia endosymbiont of Ceutorhynchus assimilis]
MISEIVNEVQLNSESFRQDKFKDELSYRTRVREYRRMSKNLLVSSDRDDAIINSLNRLNLLNFREG